MQRLDPLFNAKQEIFNEAKKKIDAHAKNIEAQAEIIANEIEDTMKLQQQYKDAVLKELMYDPELKELEKIVRILEENTKNSNNALKEFILDGLKSGNYKMKDVKNILSRHATLCQMSISGA